MQEKTLNKEFYYYYNKLSKSQKESMLSLIKSFVGKSDKPTKRVSIEQYNKELDAAEKRIDEGKYVTHEDLKAEAKQW